MKNRVLLVDDDQALINMYATRLELAGFEVATETGGQAAIRAVEHKMPHILVLDIMMPRMNGFAVIKELRKRFADSLCPVIILSNLSSAQVELNDEVANTLGLAHYLVKSRTTPAALVRTIEDTLRLRQLANDKL